MMVLKPSAFMSAGRPAVQYRRRELGLRCQGIAHGSAAEPRAQIVNSLGLRMVARYRELWYERADQENLHLLRAHIARIYKA